jgi:hypothetical protein
LATQSKAAEEGKEEEETQQEDRFQASNQIPHICFVFSGII